MKCMSSNEEGYPETEVGISDTTNAGNAAVSGAAASRSLRKVFQWTCKTLNKTVVSGR